MMSTSHQEVSRRGSDYSDAVSSLLVPISAELPQGSDLAYSILFDQIREARRADDPALAQGDWAIELKCADWRKVRALCEQVLREQSKDLQVAAWLVEALIYLDGFVGLAQGLELLHGLLSRYWPNCFPGMEEDDNSERAARIEWLDHQLPIAIQRIPLTSPQQGGHTWLQWDESRHVENLGLKDAQAKSDALAEGKLTGEVFDKAVRQSGRVFYETLSREVHCALTGLETLITTVDSNFGDGAPSMRNVRDALVSHSQLIDRLHASFSGQAPVVAAPSNVHAVSPRDNVPITATAIGALTSRLDAIQALRDVGRYFRLNEPHSPVALLAERAARWAEMPMEEWLTTVIKDQGTLSQLRELLDVPPASVGID